MPTLAPPTVPDSLADLPSLLRTADGSPLAATHCTGRSGAVDGAWGSAAALAIATIARKAPGPVLVVIPHPTDLDAVASDLLSLTGSHPVAFPAFDSLAGERPRFDAAATAGSTSFRDSPGRNRHGSSWRQCKL